MRQPGSQILVCEEEDTRDDTNDRDGTVRRQGDKTFNFEVEAPRNHVLYFEDSPRRVRVVFGGETVADSRRAKLLHEAGLLPVYYFPIEDVRMELLEESDHTTHCPFKGDASYCSA